MSDSESDENCQYELQKYSLVRFIHRGKKRKIESVDIVPTKWLDFDKTKGRCVTKFMRAPYNKEDMQLIHNLVINNIDAPEDWPTFSIEQVGRAKTYKEGLKKIQKLETQENVLTLESEDSASEAQRQLTLAVKRQKLKAEANKFKSSFSSSVNNDNQCQGIRDITNTRAAVQKDSPRVDNNDEPSCSTSTTEKIPLEVVLEYVDCSLEYNEINSIDNEVTGKFNADAPTATVSTESMLDIEHDDFSQDKSSAKDVTENLLPIVEENIINNAPIYCNNVKYSTSFEVDIIVRLDQITKDIAEMKQDIASLKATQAAATNYLADKKVLAKTAVDFEQKYKVKIPLTKYEEFQDFEEKLNRDVFLQKDIYTELKSCIDKDLVMSRSIVKMLKRFLNKDLARQFTAVRASTTNKNKYTFRSTTLCNMIEAIITKLRKEKSLITNQELFNSSLTDVFSNVGRWKS